MEQKLAGVVAISNPLSGKNKRGGFESFAKQITAYTAIDHLVTSNEAEIVQALNQCKQRGVAIIVVNGGDGTLQCVLSFLKQDTHLDYTPELLLLQAGTTSMAFGDVGCKAPLQATLEGLIAYADGQKTSFKKFNLLRFINPTHGSNTCNEGTSLVYIDSSCYTSFSTWL